MSNQEAQDLFATATPGPQDNEIKIDSKEETRLFNLVFSLAGHLKRLFILPEDSKPTADEFIQFALATIISRGTLLLFSPPGYAKSTFMTMIAKFFGILEAYPHWMVTGSMQTSEEHLVGAIDHYRAINSGEKNVEWAQFLSSPLRCLDELDKFNQYSLNAYLPVLAQGIALVGSSRNQVGKSAHILAMNSPDTPGSANFEISEYLKDRVDIELRFPDNSFVEDIRILDVTFAEDEEDLVQAMPTEATPADLIALFKVVSSIQPSEQAKMSAGLYKAVTNYCKKGAKTENKTFPGCCDECELAKAEHKLPCSKVSAISIRAAQSAIRVGKGLAFLQNKSRVEKAHIDAIFPYVMAHRVNYVGDIPHSRLHKAHQFFKDEMQPSVQRVFQIMTKPEKLLADPKQLKMLESSPNPLIAKAIAMVKSTLDKITANKLCTLGFSGAAELKDALVKMALSTSQKNLVNQMLLAKQTVYLEAAEELLDNSEFRDQFKSPAPEDEPYLSSRAWDEIAAEGRATQAFAAEMGVDINYNDGILSVMFETPESADEFADRITKKAPTGWIRKLCSYETQGLTDRIQKEGFMEGVTE